MVLLGSRAFSLSDQLHFARFSGDTNPIHVDPVAARRTIAGECIVHGVHGLMCAIELLTKYTSERVSGVNADFIKPIFLDEPVDFFWDGEACLLELRSGDTQKTRLKVQFGISERPSSQRPSRRPQLSFPENRSFEECAKLPVNEFAFAGTADDARKLFPAASAAYGINLLCEIAALSELVGMRVPGLHSLFSAVSIDLSSLEGGMPRFEVVHSDARVGLLEISVSGATLKARIRAFYRQPPTQGPGLALLSDSVTPNEFLGVNALIIGGSRGLGELVAKLIVVGGGRVTLTYKLGKEDSVRVLTELRQLSTACDAVSLDVESDFTIPDGNFNQVYFFASPKIRAEDTYSDNSALLARYRRVYCAAFQKLCLQLVAQDCQCSIFYPSTVFIEAKEKNFANYILAKEEGEVLCEQLSKSTGLFILHPRLPRLPTDQTLGIFKSKLADPVHIMLSNVRAMKR